MPFSPVEVCPKEQKANKNLYILHVHLVLLYGSETWPIKEVEVRRLKRNDERIVRWACNIRPDRIYVEKLGTKLKLNSMRECLQDRRLQ